MIFIQFYPFDVPAHKSHSFVGFLGKTDDLFHYSNQSLPIFYMSPKFLISSNDLNHLI